MPTTKAELFQGTLDLLILKTIAAGPMHGYSIAQRIQQRSDDVLVVEEGSLYPGCTGWRKKAGLRRSGEIGEQSPRQVLFADPRGAKTIGGGNGDLGTGSPRDYAGAANGLRQP